MKKLITILIVFAIIIIGVNYVLYNDPLYVFKPSLNIDKLEVISDLDKDGIDDMDDIVQGAKKQIRKRPEYKSEYYKGGYPPDNEGVCTDLIWRSLKNAGYNLKQKIDESIQNNPQIYYSIDTPDSNIDFRRVPNQYVYFKNYMKGLTTDIVENDEINLKEWQPGDIVVVSDPYPNHIGIISDRRNREGIPYVIHHGEGTPKEEQKLLEWKRKEIILGHYRLKYKCK